MVSRRGVHAGVDSRPAVAMTAHRYLSTAAAGSALLAGLVFDGCGHAPAMPTPTPDPTLQVTPIDNTGPIRIIFVSANIPPGSTVGGCGGVIEGVEVVRE